MNYFARMVILATVGVLVACMSGLAEPPRNDDKAAKDLAAARGGYETAMEALRDKIRGGISRARESLKNAPKVDGGEVNALNAASDAFEKSGVIPQDKNAKSWELQYAKLAERMLSAYGKAKLEYGKPGSEESLAVIGREEQVFAESWDLVPWGANLVADIPEASRTASEAAVQVAIGTDAEYRLEIVARAQGEPGKLRIGVPLGVGKKAELEASADAQGSYRVFLTASRDEVCAELGVSRSITIGQAPSGQDARSVSIRAGKGERIRIDSLRVKNVVKGEPPQTSKDTAKGKKQNTPKADPAESITAGSVWTGTRITGDGKNHGEPAVTVESRSGDEFVLVTERLDGHGKWVRTVRIGPGGTLTPVAVVNRGPVLTNVSVDGGEGKVSGRELRLTTRGRWSGGDTKNAVFTDTLVLKLR